VDVAQPLAVRLWPVSVRSGRLAVLWWRISARSGAMMQPMSTSAPAATTIELPAADAGSPHPTHGWTKLGHAVHARTVDHLPTGSPYARFNKRLALFITQNIGTMTCFWLFCVISLSSLLAVLYAAHIISTVGFLTANGFILCVSWVSQNFIQLVLLPALMVGQNLQNEAADARAAKTFEDVERIISLLDVHTQGGLKDLLDAINQLKVGDFGAAGAKDGAA